MSIRLLKEETPVVRSPSKLEILVSGIGRVAHQLAIAGVKSAGDNVEKLLNERQRQEDYIDFDLMSKLDKKEQSHREKLLVLANTTARLACDSWRAGGLETYDQLLSHRQVMGYLEDRSHASIHLRGVDREFLREHMPDLATNQDLASTVLE